MRWFEISFGATLGETSGQRIPLDFDTLYGKAFKITDPEGDPSRQGFSIISRIANGSVWDEWQERPQFKALARQRLNDPGFLADYKYQQIVDSAKQLGLLDQTLSEAVAIQFTLPPDIAHHVTFHGEFDPTTRIAHIFNIGSSRKGYGTKAVAAFEQWAKAQGAWKVTGESVPQSLPFWWKLGYRDKHYAIFKVLHEDAVRTLGEGAAATVVPVLYHGTCEDSAAHLIQHGWQPTTGMSSGNQGQTRYLYLSTGREDALWFAQEKGCDTVLAVRNIPRDSLIVDPEDGIGDTVEAELHLSHGLPGKLALIKPLPASHFQVAE